MIEDTPKNKVAPPPVRSVEIAFWCWIIGAVLLVLIGLLSLTTSGDAIRVRMSADGVSAGGIDAYLRLLRGFGGVTIVVGLIVGAASTPVRMGDRRFRRSLVTLSVLTSALLLALVVLGIGSVSLVAVVVLLAVSAVLVYRPAADPYFSGQRGVGGQRDV